MSEQKTRKVAVYIRVSTSEQKLEGFSPDAQRKRLLAHINENKTLNLETRSEWIFEDTSTGSDLNREGYKKMMKLVEKGEIDAVLVWRIDRLSRNLKHLIASFEKAPKTRCELHFLAGEHRLQRTYWEAHISNIWSNSGV
jgi:DNA invertase Pin-like site-specific DNA recombinase